VLGRAPGPRAWNRAFGSGPASAGTMGTNKSRVWPESVSFGKSAHAASQRSGLPRGAAGAAPAKLAPCFGRRDGTANADPPFGAGERAASGDGTFGCGQRNWRVFFREGALESREGVLRDPDLRHCGSTFGTSFWPAVVVLEQSPREHRAASSGNTSGSQRTLRR
jgi:hypothetical protein